MAVFEVHVYFNHCLYLDLHLTLRNESDYCVNYDLRAQEEIDQTMQAIYVCAIYNTILTLFIILFL